MPLLFGMTEEIVQKMRSMLIGKSMTLLAEGLRRPVVQVAAVVSSGGNFLESEVERLRNAGHNVVRTPWGAAAYRI